MVPPTHRGSDAVPDADAWDLPDHLTWEECLEETAFPARRADRIPDPEEDRSPPRPISLPPSPKVAGCGGGCSSF